MTTPVTAADVATWLRNHPDFLQQHPDLAFNLVLPRSHGSTASLASYQLEILREKNRELNQRLHTLIHNAHSNERLAVRTQQLTLTLMRQTTLADTVQAMAASLQEDFAGDHICIVLHHPVPALEAAPWLQIHPQQSAAMAIFADVLESTEPVCGRLRADKNQLLYGAAVEQVASSALLILPNTGLVALGSSDANRFYPGMGTLFLQMMGTAFMVAVQRFIDTEHAPAPQSSQQPPQHSLV